MTSTDLHRWTQIKDFVRSRDRRPEISCERNSGSAGGAAVKAGISGLASKVSYDFIIDAFKRNIRSGSWLMTPLKWPEMVIPIGFTLLALMLMVQIAKVISAIRAGASTEAITEERAEETSV